MGHTGRWRRGVTQLGCAAALALLLAPTAARAGRVTDLATTFDEKGIVNGGVRATYQRTLRRGAIKREFAGRSEENIDLVKELRFNEVRHLIDVRAEFAIFKALQVYLQIPIVVGDTRSFDFAQNGGDPCGSPPETSCVTPRNSTLTRDGFLDGAAMQPNQVAIAGPDGAPGGLVLPNRRGLDQIYIGLAGTPLSQVRDPTKPTWVIGFEARVAVGGPMEYDPRQPTANTSVGRGLHEYLWYTVVSRRFKYLDPWFSLFYILPQVKGGSLFGKTSFDAPPSGQERSSPQQRGGGELGVEIIPWEQPQHRRRLTIELSGRIEGIFEGRGYSDMWELLANQPGLMGPCRPELNSLRPGGWNNGTYCASPDQNVPFPGITNIENYAIYGGSLAVGVEMTRFLRARLGVSLAHEQQHFITFGDPGRSGKAANLSGPCAAAGPNAICSLDETQVNPMYRPIIDGTGHRFKVADTTIFDVFVGVQGQF